MSQISVVTYNILSKLLCNETSYSEPDYYASILNYQNRYQRLWIILEKHIAKRAVICLQEVDSETSCRLQLDFKKGGYDFYYHPYGTPFNGYMGVVIAVPNQFVVKQVNRFRLVDGKEWPEVNKSYFDSLLKYATFGYFNNDYDNWNRMKNRFNFMLTVELEEQPGKSIFVSTVHLPCAFKNSSIMITTAALAVEHLQKIAGNSPYILTGDFNIVPNSEPYNLITNGYCDVTSIRNDYPANDIWNPNELELRPMKSAIRSFHGKEAEWTNYSISGVFGEKKPLKLTLDYIFVSIHFTVKNAFKSAEKDNICPNESEPSDHVLVWADLELINLFY